MPGGQRARSSVLAVRMTTAQVGWLKSQTVADLALAAQVSTGSQRHFKAGRSREQDFSLIPTNEIRRKATLIWVANRCKLATVRFLSVEEKRGEGEEGKAGRTQGSWRNDVHFFVDFFFFGVPSPKGSQL